MNTYYYSENLNAYFEKVREIHDAHKEEVETVWSGNAPRGMFDKVYKTITNEVRDMVAQTYPCVEGSRKDDVCAQVCEICDRQGMTEADIFRPDVANSSRAFVQHWYVYKADGVWYQKSDRTSKTSHEVEL